MTPSGQKNFPEEQKSIRKAQSSLIKRESPFGLEGPFGLECQKASTKETRLEVMISDKVFDQIKNIEIIKEHLE